MRFALISLITLVNEILPSYTKLQGIACLLITFYLCYNCARLRLAGMAAGMASQRRGLCRRRLASLPAALPLPLPPAPCRRPLRALPGALGQRPAGAAAAVLRSCCRCRPLPSCSAPRPLLSTRSHPHTLQASFFASLAWTSLVIVLATVIQPGLKPASGLWTTLLWAGVLPCVAAVWGLLYCERWLVWVGGPGLLTSACCCLRITR